MPTPITRVLICALLTPAFTLAAQPVPIDEIEVVGRRINLVGDATSASEGRISREELAPRPLLRAGDLYFCVEVRCYDGPWDDIEEAMKKTNVWLK